MIDCYYPNCDVCQSNNYCYLKDDAVAFIEDNLSNLIHELEELSEYYKHKESGGYYVPFSFDELSYKISIVLDDIFKLYKEKQGFL